MAQDSLISYTGVAASFDLGSGNGRAGGHAERAKAFVFEYLGLRYRYQPRSTELMGIMMGSPESVLVTSLCRRRLKLPSRSSVLRCSRQRLSMSRPEGPKNVRGEYYHSKVLRRVDCSRHRKEGGIGGGKEVGGIEFSRSEVDSLGESQLRKWIRGHE